MSWSAQFGKSWVIVGGLPAATAATSFGLRVPYVPWYWALTTIPGFSLLKSLVSSSMAGLSTPLIPCQNVIVTGPPPPAGRVREAGRDPARRLGTHPPGLIEQRELFLFHVGHQADLFLFDRDLVRVDLALALRRQEPAAAHRERVGEQHRHPGDQDDVARYAGAQDA